MVRITLDLVRKRAEHNEGQVSTLEELSLHQQDIERIEHLHRWCPRLKILYLQGNLISKIENMGRLRDLEYLNLALNNLERVEGLARCESLYKLDLTANFITDITSLTSLQDLPCLTQLYMTGNPCTTYRGYRPWVICMLPGLEELDGTRVTRSERLRALQELSEATTTVMADQQQAMEKRAMERETSGRDGESSNEENEEDDEKWWSGTSTNTPETRLAIHRHIARKRNDNNNTRSLTDGYKKKREVRLFTADGRPLNVNAANVQFTLTEDEENNCFVLEVNTYRHLDASLVACDVEPWYVRVTVRGKPLQLVLMEEVRPGQAVAKRSQITGHLVVTVPKLAPPRFPFLYKTIQEEKITPVTSSYSYSSSTSSSPSSSSSSSSAVVTSTSQDERKVTRALSYLEVGDKKPVVDYTNIVSQDNNGRGSINTSSSCASAAGTRRQPVPQRPNSPDFVDDVSVPPLE